MKILIVFLSAVLVPHLYAIPVELVQKIIPVEVRYDQIIPGIVSREQVLVHGRRNLDAKVQLSSDELPQALKHLPLQVEPEILAEADEGKLQLAQEEDAFVKTLVQPENQAAIIDVIPENPVEVLQVPVPVSNEIPFRKSLLEPESNFQEKAVKNPLDIILSESKNIITNSLKKLKESFTTGKDEFSPSPEQWAVLEKQVNEYFDEEKNKLLIRQTQTETAEAGNPSTPPAQGSQNNWFQNIAAGVSNIATTFVQNLQNLGGTNNGASAGAQGDEGTSGQQPGNQGLQNFVNMINTGFGNLISTITGNNSQGPTTSNTNLSDSGSGTPAPSGPVGFFGTVFTNVQNALGIQQGQGGGGGGAVQGDTGTQQQAGGPGQFIQSFGNAITNFFQGGNKQPPNAQGDTGTAPAQPSNNNIIQNIQNAILNNPLNPFRPQGGQNTQNPIQTAIQNVGAQVQQLAPAGAGNSPTQAPTDGVKKPESGEILADVKPPTLVLPGEDIKPVIENEVVKKQLEKNV